MTNKFLVEPTVAEALATLHAVEFSCELGFYDIIVEGDALQIVNAVKVGITNWSKFRHIVEDIKERMHLLRSCRIEHVKKTQIQ